MSIPERLKQALATQAWEDFADTLAEIDTADVALLPDLYECFTDEAAALPVLWQLLHRIEDFEEEAGLLALLQSTPSLQEHAPTWLEILWARTLNSAEAFTRLKHEMLPLHDFPAVRSYLQTSPALQEQARRLFS